MSAAELPLDEFQRDVLAELGLHPYVLAGATSAADVAGIASELLQALARAAAVSPETIASLPVMSQLQQLRTDAAAKRALWPLLRRLRASSP